MQSALFALLNHRLLHFLFIILAIIGVYGHTLDVPFYLDDFSSIQENPIIYQWQGTIKELWQFAPMRTVGYLSFALNYQVHQFQVDGYHIVNISIHVLASLAVWGLLLGLVRTPALKDQLSPAAQLWLPLITALFFALHPLQIQAVTYVVQRLASLAALFYILGMMAYVYARLTSNILPRLSWISLLIVCMSLGILTKQNTATLPFSLLLMELVFFPHHLRRLLIIGGVAMASLVGIWVMLALAFQYNPFSLQAMEALTKETTAISRESYLATQFNVLWTYIKLFFYPVGMQIDYDYPITETLFNPQTLLALAGHLTLLIIGFFSLRRWPIIAFGILFYYLSHAVESSVIPIRDVVFEHRTYLPNLGLFALCAWVLVVQVPRWLDRNTAILLVLAITMTLGTMTWMRNQVWRNPIALWQDNVEQSPSKKRAWVILGKHLIQAERPQEGIKALLRSGTKLENPDGSSSTTYSAETLLNLVVAYKKLKQYQQALNIINQVIKNPSIDILNRAKFHINRGNIYYELEQFGEAEKSYLTALQFYPNSISARANLASIFAATGRLQEAENTYLDMLIIDPHNTVILQNLEKVRRMR
ncbi:tetratricopeptide repeat protein [Candidatus Albibeggiatoa sp. nov. BB20]|uniref:tetratricopeptide repeat protein n=1 Tax=Candidatus Albibeggiatoa sp. nov. BB20 TaxID=3162723 RepID=UPI0033654D35